MRTYGALNPLGTIAMPPDTVMTMAVGPAAAAAMDWANSTVGAADAKAYLVCFTGVSSGGAALNFMVNLVSTHANLPTTGTSVTTGTTAGSTGNSIPVNGEAIFQIPAWSTGWSAIALSSGYVMAQVWRK